MIKEHKWDLKSVTCADFTVKINFPDNFWETYKNKLKFVRQKSVGGVTMGKKKGKFLREAFSNQKGEDKTLPLASGESFKEYFKIQVLNEVNQLPKELNCHSESNDIANIQFGYANRELIRLLKARGAAMNNAEFSEIFKLEQEINSLIEGEDYELLMKPICAFVTFTHQEASERCNMNWERKYDIMGYPKYNKGKYMQILGQKFQVARAPETTDIIWENLQIPNSTKVIRKALILLMLFTIIFGIIVILLGLRELMIGPAVKMYPATRDCDHI